MPGTILPSQKTEIIWDFDRTIATMRIDWTEWHQGVGQLLQSYEKDFTIPPPGEKITYAIQNTLLAKHGRRLGDALVRFTREYEAKHLQGFEPYEKAVTLIRNSVGKNFFVWSSNSADTINKALTAFDLSSHIKKIVSRESVLFTKPDPKGFALLYDPAIPLGRYLFIGDSPTDKEAADTSHIDYLDITAFAL